eukprot:TRINITY_DN5857_c0_g1_i1.p2 TRINITY_DN5857_c0_g1~~TRINITY_DN5857_c0_g1_i1.p2  ORF type:complete len:119 (+),score=18.06 TRINITY_DN5857_c0_g1_i1:2-358(+)
MTELRNGESTRVNEEAKQAIIDAGGVVRQLDPAQRKQWVDTMKPVWAKFEGDIGADLIETAQSYNATNQEDVHGVARAGHGSGNAGSVTKEGETVPPDLVRGRSSTGQQQQKRRQGGK